MANKLRASGQIQDKDRYIPISEAKKQMVAMLEELNLEIDEMFARRIDYTVDKIQDLIQQKIDELKAESEG